MIKEMLYVFVILLGIPVGNFLSVLCKEEVGVWKKRFRIIALISFLFVVVLFFISFENKIPIVVFLFFVITVSLNIRLKKSSSENLKNFNAKR